MVKIYQKGHLSKVY